ncbi:MAG: Xaa-Pro peptidase family protein [Gammaproteobacteria bacterium]|nr:Xaa-Pro peptidase family protein [Gammaproteobacteria bacterium]
MALQFSRDEYDARQRKACAKMADEGLDGLLIFRQESMYYLTGYDTGGYTMFQGMYMNVDGEMVLLVRSADRIQSRLTSVVEDIRVWVDREGANPADDVRQMIDDLGGRGKRIGVEYHAYGLTAQRGKMVDAVLQGFCELVDGSDLVRVLRLVKSPAELEYVRKAGELSDQAWGVANRMSKPGEFLGNVYGEMLNVIMRGDGDPTASRWPMGAGEDALFVRYHTGKNVIGAHDQVQHEFAAAYRHYHAAAMSVVLTGEASATQRDMFKACVDALQATEETLRPGNTVGDVFDAHAKTFIEAGYGDAYLNACGYTMGATYPPTWMDWPMFWTGNPQVLEPGMVYFLHMILLDDKTGLTMSLGETVIVTEGACEPVNNAPRELVIN